MRSTMIAATAAFLAGAALTLSASSRDAKSPVGHLAGIWSAPVYEVPLNSDFDRSVWGPNASHRRNVDLAIESTGDGILTVRTAVVDSKGRTKPGSVSVSEARISVGLPEAGGEAPIVSVLSAERTYPDDPSDRWPLDGLAVKVSPVASDANRINIRFDTPEGTGSFGETLVRQRPRAGTRAQR